MTNITALEGYIGSKVLDLNLTPDPPHIPYVLFEDSAVVLLPKPGYRIISNSANPSFKKWPPVAYLEEYLWREDTLDNSQTLTLEFDCGTLEVAYQRIPPFLDATVLGERTRFTIDARARRESKYVH